MFSETRPAPHGNVTEEASTSPSHTLRPEGTGGGMRIWLVLAAVTFVAHFLLFPQFGLYEDDYIYTLPKFGMGFQDWLGAVKDALLHPIQARPLNHAVRRTFFALTLHGNTLDLAYLLSWVMISTNAFLLYRLVAQRLAPTAGAVAALVYLLHPADNARQIIMHQTDIHFGAMLLLCSLNLFLARRPVLAWLVGAASLVNYESFYLPLLAAPLLLAPAPFREWKKSLRHVLVWGGLLAGVALTRYLLGEDRTTAAAEAPLVVAAKILRAMLIGPATSLRLLLQRPVDALLHLTPLLATVTLFVGIISYRLIKTGKEAATTATRLNPGWVVLGGALGLVITYLFAFRPGAYPPILSIGRLTALHAPGILCTSMAVGAVFYWVQHEWRRLNPRILSLLLAASFGLMAAFALQIQLTEYVASWTKQRDFWRQIFAQAKDVSDGEYILVDVEGPEDVIPITPGFPRFGTVNYPPQALKYFATLPPGWKHPPRVYGLWADTPAEAGAAGLALKTPPYFGPDQHPLLQDGNFIFFRAENGFLKRMVQPVNIRGHLLTPKAIPSQASDNPLTPTALYRALIEPRQGRDWFSIRDSRNYPE